MFDFIEKASEKTTEKLFMKLLDGFNREDLETATRTNASLLLLTEKNNPKLLKTASMLARGFRGQKVHLNLENVLKWLRERRPNFWLAIHLDAKKQRWLEKNILELKDFLFNQ